jgi:hypothetical protein
MNLPSAPQQRAQLGQLFLKDFRGLVVLLTVMVGLWSVAWRRLHVVAVTKAERSQQVCSDNLDRVFSDRSMFGIFKEICRGFRGSY